MKPTSRILVPVCGNSADREAVEMACRLAKGNKSEIHLLYVIQVKRSLPLDARMEPETQKGETVLYAAESIAEELGQEVKTDLVQAREVGPAIIEEARERGVELTVMGVNYKRRFGEFDLGEVVPYVLKNAHCRIFLVRQPFPVK